MSDEPAPAVVIANAEVASNALTPTTTSVTTITTTANTGTGTGTGAGVTTVGGKEIRAAGADEAAAKIQAGFRGYKVRKRLQEERKAGEKFPHVQPADLSKQLMEERPQKALEEKSATKIQAGVRGFLVRKRQQAEQAAATRIQAGFRGFRTRKLLKQNGQ